MTPVRLWAAAGLVPDIVEPSPEELGRVPADMRRMFEHPNRGDRPIEDVNHSHRFVAARPGLARSRLDLRRSPDRQSR